MARLRSQPWLWYTGLFHLVLLLFALVGAAVDTRTIDGVNPWHKPIKFDVSIVVYLWTMAWILGELPKDFARRIARGMALAMIVETALIGMQALRGQASHFNNSSTFNALVYALMGLSILYNFYLIIRITAKFFWGAFRLPRPYLRSIQLGLLCLVLGNLFGIYISVHSTRFVGIPVPGVAIPFLNWSRTAGDLRVAHFAAMHGIQFLLLLGSYVSRARTPIPEFSGVMWVNFAALIYAAVCVGLFIQALSGTPLF